MIIILTGPNDPHADAVIERLERRGAEYLRFDEADYPARANLSLRCAPDGRSATILRTQERSVDLERVSTIWRRRPSPPEAPDAVQDPAWRHYVELECEAMLTAVWHTLPCRWLPAPTSVLRRADLKPLQLKLAAELGLELPPTLITSDPQAFLDFYREHDGDLVSKLLGTAMTKALKGSQLARFTQRVTRRDVGYADSIRYAPMIFQAYVPKRVELRITVVGEQVFAAEIHSQKANRTRVDWRRYDMTHTPHYPHTLPDDVRRGCLELVRRLGLRYGAIDMVLTPDGRYVFLEINPNGQYLWIETSTGLPISDAICDLLMERAAA